MQVSWYFFGALKTEPYHQNKILWCVCVLGGRGGGGGGGGWVAGK